MQDTPAENVNLLETVKQIFCKAKVSVNADNIISVKRIGNTEGFRPILVIFKNQDIKYDIFRKVNNFNILNIGVSNDLSRELREKKKLQYNKLLECKSLLEEQGKSIKIQGHYIIIDHKTYDLDMTLKYLLSSQHVPPTFDELSDGEDDDTAKSTIPMGNKKRGRTPGSKNDARKKIKTLSSKVDDGPIKKVPYWDLYTLHLALTLNISWLHLIIKLIK